MNGRSTICNAAVSLIVPSVRREEREVRIHRREPHSGDAVTHLVLRRSPRPSPSRADTP
jgi:hypothetical protein